MQPIVPACEQFLLGRFHRQGFSLEVQLSLFPFCAIGGDRRNQIAERPPGLKGCNVHGLGKHMSELVYQRGGLAVAVDIEGLG
ncbi:hypothetical protein D3C81_936890 [compost metagenome]